MKLGLIQTKHNQLYDFLNPVFPYTQDECIQLQQQQFEQNIYLLTQAKDQQFDLLVTTECINYIRTANHNQKSDAGLYPALDCQEIRQLSKVAASAHSWLIAGFGYSEGANAYNSALIFNRDGILTDIYHKTHLAGDESNIFTPGDQLKIIHTDFGCIGVCICWDMQFPETARTMALSDASLVVCPTWGWEAELYGRARAYENGIFTAAAMAVPAWGPIQFPRTPSSAVSPDGQLICCASSTDCGIVSCTIDLAETQNYHEIRLSQRRPELYRIS